MLVTIKWGHTTRFDAYIDNKPSIVILEPYSQIAVTGHISKFTFYGGRESETETYIQTYRKIGAMRYRMISRTKVRKGIFIEYMLISLCISLDHEIQKGCILGVSSPHKLENFHWYFELGPLLGFTKQVFASLRSGAVLYNGHFLCAPYNHAEIFKIRHFLDVFDAGLFT